ncbi:hypothetical protein BCR41DRAFT_360499 [Lobosporangium transversale]|uniref:F-box domain-containing protein n=1 Tax=Lobosporangium transversale TaxID=64571 RepID=A0A1Y2GGQ1_9FUNG|nr:hypothetical protein BCR41DRAFT_360499 [Lobosporangium transversale]ORZ07025.1 hypothetical protein BCR41DRAFT_360499 [Lobosporangium transversale]|eukprot:XP_021877821.1 hypothetical protein BCR41DRAFT_360499 [Lobosporangium transversale]
MDSLKLNPLEFPEILLLIGESLDRSDLLSCIRVSKYFHRIFIRLVWREITITSSRNPTGRTIYKHKGYIKEIIFNDYTFRASFPKMYGQLQGLKSITYGKRCRWPTPIHLVNQIKVRSSIITSFRLTAKEASLELWKALLECTNLNHLEVYHVYTEVAADLFLQVCKKVRHLELDNAAFQLPINFMSSGDSEYLLPNIRTLRIHNVSIVNNRFSSTGWYCLGMLVKNCPALCSLNIGNYSKGDPTAHAKFYRVVHHQRPWTLSNLSDLSINMRINDKDLATLLRRMTKLKRLCAPYGLIDELTLQELLADKQEVMDSGQLVQKTRLWRLCETVETLKLNGRSGFAHTILSNCPRLKSLAGVNITVTEIIEGAEWVCTGLTQLAIDLEVDVDQETEEGMTKTRIAFRRLGKLTQLEHIDLADWNSYFEVEWASRGVYRRSLDLRLKSGLDELANLKRLRSLSFERDKHQRIQLEDAEWMVNNWPNLECVLGDLNESSVATLLKKHNISTNQY